MFAPSFLYCLALHFACVKVELAYKYNCESSLSLIVRDFNVFYDVLNIFVSHSVSHDVRWEEPDREV